MIDKKIKEFRQLRGLSQTELAKLMHVKQNTISNWETGRTEPNMGAVIELCKIFDCRPSDLIGDAGEHHDRPLTPDEARLIALYGVLTREEQEILIGIAETMIKRRIGE